MSSLWEVLAAVAQRNGVDALVLCGHLTTAHGDVDPYGPGWPGACEAAAACLVSGEHSGPAGALDPAGGGVR